MQRSWMISFVKDIESLKPWAFTSLSKTALNLWKHAGLSDFTFSPSDYYPALVCYRNLSNSKSRHPRIQRMIHEARQLSPENKDGVDKSEDDMWMRGIKHSSYSGRMLALIPQNLCVLCISQATDTSMCLLNTLPSPSSPLLCLFYLHVPFLSSPLLLPYH